MTLTVLEEALLPVMKTLDQKDFATLLHDVRNAIGLKRYRAAEFIGVAPARLKNLETGYFRVMPSDAELLALARLYSLEFNILHQKAELYVKAREKTKKVRVQHEGL